MNAAFENKFFLPYQRAWIQDSASLRIVEKGRQIGLTTADAYDSVKKALARGGTLDVWVSSRDLPTARAYLRTCKRWAQTLQVAAQGPEWEVIDHAKDLGAFTLRFKSGRCIFSLSSNPDALVGKTGHIKLDEFAVHREQAELYRIAKPCTTWGGQLSIISTHRGHHTVFNEILRDIKERGNPMRWSHHRVTLEDAVSQGLAEKINSKVGVHASACPPLAPDCPSGRDSREARRSTEPDGFFPGSHSVEQSAYVVPPLGGPASRAAFLSRLRSECLDEEQWLQEYCCQPADDNSAFLTWDMITACESPDCLKPFSYLGSSSSDPSCSSDNSLFRVPHSAFYAGIDVARKHHLCVIDVGEKIGDVLWDRFRIELHNKTFSEIEHELFRILELPQLKRACIDATGLGMQLAERARERFGWKVEPITFTPQIKEELAFNLRRAFEDRLLRIDLNPALRSDLRAIRKEVTSSGHIRFLSEPVGRDSVEPSHADRFWAKALRQRAANYKQTMGFVFLD